MLIGVGFIGCWAFARNFKNKGENMTNCDCSAEMPKYKCFKEVWALKIKSIKSDGEGEERETDGSAMITPEENQYAPFKVDCDYMHKHKPSVGGYYVVYQDGYKSFSPAKAFEEGYARV